MKLKRVAIMGSAVMCVFAASALAAQISVEPEYQEVFHGDNVTVDIKVYPEESEIYSASYTLHFNNTLLMATSWTQGEFLTRDGNSSTMWAHEIDNIIGKFEYAESRVGTDVGGIGGAPGNLTTITFQVIGDEGVSPLDISDLDGELLYSTSGPIPTEVNNGTCKIIEQTPTSTPLTQPTTTITATPMQTPTTIPITPTSAETAIQTSTIPSMPSPPPTIITSPTPTASTPAFEEKSEENSRLSGFKATFAIIGLFAVLISKRRNVRR